MSLPGTHRVKLMYLIKFQCSLWFSELVFDKVDNHKFKLARLARFENSKCDIFHRNSGTFWYVMKASKIFSRHTVLFFYLIRLLTGYPAPFVYLDPVKKIRISDRSWSSGKNHICYNPRINTMVRPKKFLNQTYVCTECPVKKFLASRYKYG